MGKTEKVVKRAKTLLGSASETTEDTETVIQPEECQGNKQMRKNKKRAEIEDPAAPMPPSRPTAISPELNLTWLVLITFLVLSSALCYQWILPHLGAKSYTPSYIHSPPPRQHDQENPHHQFEEELPQQQQEGIPQQQEVREDKGHNRFKAQMSSVTVATQQLLSSPGKSIPPNPMKQDTSYSPKERDASIEVTHGPALGRPKAVIIEQDPSYQMDSRDDNREQGEDPVKVYSKKVGYTIFAVGEEEMYEDEFVYVRNNENRCEHNGTEKQLVIFVLSDVKNVLNRHVIRDTWGSTFITGDWSVQVVFIMGSPDPMDYGLEAELDEEYLRMEDMVQGQFIDHPKNSTMKHLMALHWVHTHCSNATMFASVDDETFVHTIRLTAYLDGRYTGTYDKYREKVLQCAVMRRHEPVREPSDRKYVGRYEYPYEKYPTHCMKHAYIASPDMVATLYRSSLTSLRYWMDDVYVTGLIPHHLGIPLRTFERDYGITEDESIEDTKEVNKYNFVHMPEIARSGSTIGKWGNMWTNARNF